MKRLTVVLNYDSLCLPFHSIMAAVPIKALTLSIPYQIELIKTMITKQQNWTYLRKLNLTHLNQTIISQTNQPSPTCLIIFHLNQYLIALILNMQNVLSLHICPLEDKRCQHFPWPLTYLECILCHYVNVPNILELLSRLGVYNKHWPNLDYSKFWV